MTRRLVVTSAGPVRMLPPPQPSMWARILAFFHLGGPVSPQPPANVVATFSQAVYNPGDVMEILVSGQSVNMTAVPFVVPITVADQSVSPPQPVVVQAKAAINQPNPLTASQGDESGRAWQQGTPAMTAGGAFSTSFSATA